MSPPAESFGVRVEEAGPRSQQEAVACGAPECFWLGQGLRLLEHAPDAAFPLSRSHAPLAGAPSGGDARARDPFFSRLFPRDRYQSENPCSAGLDRHPRTARLSSGKIGSGRGEPLEGGVRATRARVARAKRGEERVRQVRVT